VNPIRTQSLLLTMARGLLLLLGLAGSRLGRWWLVTATNC
jgi:hypothetical protein